MAEETTPAPLLRLLTSKVLCRAHSIVAGPIRDVSRAPAEGQRIRWSEGFVESRTPLRFRFSLSAPTRAAG
jgi:hypothetical protein